MADLTLLKSNMPYVTVPPLGDNYSDITPALSYEDIITTFTNLATNYPDKTDLDIYGQSHQLNNLYVLRILDDNIRPILGISLGIHGNETAVHRSTLDFIDSLLQATEGPLKQITDIFSVYLFININPDGMILNIRENANGVNLNRNWPYYWGAHIDLDKGSAPSSEPETYHFQNYMTLAKCSRVLYWVDVHGWESKTTWGWLTEQLFHSSETQRLQRTIFGWIDSLVKHKDFNLFTILNEDPRLTEYHSARKPYIYTWIKNRARLDAYCGIFEYPLSENAGLCNSFFIEVLYGSFLGCLDYYTGDIVEGFQIMSQLEPPINNNYDLLGWNDIENRPHWFRGVGLYLTSKVDPETSVNYIESYRDEYATWTHTVAFGGYVQLGDNFYIVGGENDLGTTALGKWVTPDNATVLTVPLLPEPALNGAMCTDGRYLYFVGGYYNLTYLTSIYRLDTEDMVSGWSLWSNLSVGRQRHSCEVWDNKLLVIGGRDSSSYLSTIIAIDLTTKAESFFCNFTTARGWHSSTVHQNALYIFGGWSGITARSDVRKIDLVTATEVSSYVLPTPKRRGSFALDSINNIGYFSCGDDGTNFSSSIYKFDFLTDTVSNVEYDLDSQEYEDGDISTISPPLFIGTHSYYDHIQDRLIIVGGEDNLSVFYSRVYEYDVLENVLYLREAFQTNYGYVRSTQAFSCNPGEKYSINVSIRSGQPISETANPYFRLMVLTGPLSSLIRKVRSQYTCPPQNVFTDYSLAFEIEPGESEFRVYIRHYGNGTKLDLRCFELTSTNINGFTISP